jgi:hypothetical protein
MTKLRSQLAEALQANRDLQNQIHEVEFPLRKRIREIEVERDQNAALLVEARRLADVDRKKIDQLEQGIEAAMAFIRWQLSSGKTERGGNL